MKSADLARVMIVGGGFAGLEAAKTLSRAKVEITLIDRQNHHCFQPLLYQVATAALSPADIAWPIRSILSAQENVRVVMGDVIAVDRRARLVKTAGGQSYPFPTPLIISYSLPVLRTLTSDMTTGLTSRLG